MTKNIRKYTTLWQSRITLSDNNGLDKAQLDQELLTLIDWFIIVRYEALSAGVGGFRPFWINSVKVIDPRSFSPF